MLRLLIYKFFHHLAMAADGSLYEWDSDSDY